MTAISPTVRFYMSYPEVDNLQVDKLHVLKGVDALNGHQLSNIMAVSDASFTSDNCIW